MSRLLYRLSYPAAVPHRRRTGRSTHPNGCRIPSVRGCTEGADRAPMRNRTADLLLTMETLCLLTYRGRMGGRQRGRADPPRYTARRGLRESLHQATSGLTIALLGDSMPRPDR